MFAQSPRSNLLAPYQLPVGVNSVGDLRILHFHLPFISIFFNLTSSMDIENCIEASYEKMELKELAAAISWNRSPEELVAYIQEHHVSQKTK